jgi:hypothetical protein
LDYVLERELAVRLKVREAHAEGRTVLVGPARREASRLVVFRRTGSGIDEDSFDLPGGANLVSASPHGNTFFVSLHGRAKLLHYPGWDEADAWSLRAPGSGLRAPGVDWTSKVVWGFEDDNSDMVIYPFDRSWRRSVAGRSWPPLELSSVGSGVLRAGAHGVRLFEPQGPVVEVLPPTSRLISDVSVTGGGRMARVRLGTKLVKFWTDLRAGSVHSEAVDVVILARAQVHRRHWNAVVHPSRDLMAIPHRGGVQVVGANGLFLCRLTGSATPCAWLPDRTTLLTKSKERTGLAMELWDLGC